MKHSFAPKRPTIHDLEVDTTNTTVPSGWCCSHCDAAGPTEEYVWDTAGLVHWFDQDGVLYMTQDPVARTHTWHDDGNVESY